MKKSTNNNQIQKGSGHTQSSIFLWGWKPADDRVVAEPEDDDSDVESFAITEESDEEDSTSGEESLKVEHTSRDSAGSHSTPSSNGGSRR